MDKEKALSWLAMDSPKESRQDNQELVSAAKIINDFENPSISSDFNTSNERRRDEEVAAKQQQTERKSRIAQHIDNLLNKHGAKTSVYQKWSYFKNARLVFVLYLVAL